MLLADDHVRMRARIRTALEAGGCVVCAEGGSADDAIAQAREHRPDVALLDIHMPGNGIRAAEEISRMLPETAVVMLTASAEEDDLFDSLRAGARGFLLKDGDPRVWSSRCAGSSPAARRCRPLRPGSCRSSAHRPAPCCAAGPGATKLSAREWEVMELLAGGASTDETAQRLFLSPATVRFHVASVVRKLHVADREEAFKLLRE